MYLSLTKEYLVRLRWNTEEMVRKLGLVKFILFW